MVDPIHLREILDSHHEWLLVRETGRSFALTCREIGILDGNGHGAELQFLDENGLHSRVLSGYSLIEGEISLDLADASDGTVETVRLVPRTPAAELAAEVEIARLEKTNEIARMISEHLPGAKIGRVALNNENGRLAQITFYPPDNKMLAAIADVTASLPIEALFTSSLIWLEKLGMRKKRPITDIWIICEKGQAKNAQKLHALLSDRWKSKITIYEIVRKKDPVRLNPLSDRRIRDLWREKATGLKLQAQVKLSNTAEAVKAFAPQRVDVIYSNRGETLRYHGLPFVRTRVMSDKEKAWFGIGSERHILTDAAWNELIALLVRLEKNRSPFAGNKRHEYYRASPEAWLESALRRDISLLDANLILSPIYNQFRSSNDKIDLLALRRDGRLVIIELKTQPDREMVFQAADYWRKIELQRRRGILAAANLFDGREILDKPALVYLAAPAWSFHRDFEFFARAISNEIEMWRFELHENWREQIRVLARHRYTDAIL